MRRETIRALEVRKNSVMAERRKSAMQTLGANNEYGITTAPAVVAPPPNGVSSRHPRISNAGINVKDVFDPSGGPGGNYGTTGQLNQAYEPVIDEDGNSLRLTPRNQVSWSNSTDRRL